jgi:hypothetical protein
MVLVLRVAMLSLWDLFLELFNYLKVSCVETGIWKIENRMVSHLLDLICLHFHFMLSYSHKTVSLIFDWTMSSL